MFTPHEPPMSLKAALARAYGSPAFCQSGRPTAVDATLAPFAASRFGGNGRPRAYPPAGPGLAPKGRRRLSLNLLQKLGLDDFQRALRIAAALFRLVFDLFHQSFLVRTVSFSKKAYIHRIFFCRF